MKHSDLQSYSFCVDCENLKKVKTDLSKRIKRLNGIWRIGRRADTDFYILPSIFFSCDNLTSIIQSEWI